MILCLKGLRKISGQNFQWPSPFSCPDGRGGSGLICGTAGLPIAGLPPYQSSGPGHSGTPCGHWLNSLFPDRAGRGTEEPCCAGGTAAAAREGAGYPGHPSSLILQTTPLLPTSGATATSRHWQGITCLQSCLVTVTSSGRNVPDSCLRALGYYQTVRVI